MELIESAQAAPPGCTRIRGHKVHHGRDACRPIGHRQTRQTRRRMAVRDAFDGTAAAVQVQRLSQNAPAAFIRRLASVVT